MMPYGTCQLTMYGRYGTVQDIPDVHEEGLGHCSFSAAQDSEVVGIVLGCNHSFYCVLLPSMPKVPAKNLKAVAISAEFNSQKKAPRKHGLKFPKRVKARQHLWRTRDSLFE